MTEIVAIEFVDYGVCGEYGMFGKVVARADVREMDAAGRAREVAEMKAIVGAHVVAIEVEEVPACAAA